MGKETEGNRGEEGRGRQKHPSSIPLRNKYLVTALDELLSIVWVSCPVCHIAEQQRRIQPTKPCLRVM